MLEIIQGRGQYRDGGMKRRGTEDREGDKEGEREERGLGRDKENDRIERWRDDEEGDSEERLGW